MVGGREWIGRERMVNKRKYRKKNNSCSSMRGKIGKRKKEKKLLNELWSKTAGKRSRKKDDEKKKKEVRRKLRKLGEEVRHLEGWKWRRRMVKDGLFMVFFVTQRGGMRRKKKENHVLAGQWAFLTKMFSWRKISSAADRNLSKNLQKKNRLNKK